MINNSLVTDPCRLGIARIRLTDHARYHNQADKKPEQPKENSPHCTKTFCIFNITHNLTLTINIFINQALTDLPNKTDIVYCFTQVFGIREI